jgi:uncharacterized protein
MTRGRRASPGLSGRLSPGPIQRRPEIRRTAPTPDIEERTMSRRGLLGILILCAVLVPVAGAVWAADLGIITGSEKGTYYQFGLNLQALGKASKISMNVLPSKGSIENLYAVYQRPGVPLGIVQADALAFVSKMQSDPVLKRIARRTKMVFPLYNEEIHILGRKDIHDFEDLAGKRVAFGREGSGTYLTARLLFKTAEVEPGEMVPIDTDEALAALKSGRIDAMFYVAGFPVKLFVDSVTANDNLALIPITSKNILEYYPTSEIPANTYPWQPTPVPTAAVKSVLVSYDFRGPSCDTVGRFAQLLYTNHAWLTANGHPKWKAVNLDASLKGWEQYSCVSKYLRKPGAAPVAKSETSGNPVMDAIREMLE